jgi:hypothetical protein
MADNKIYRMSGIDTAIELLRPDARYQLNEKNEFSIWDDERPKPSWDEVLETQKKAKEFENSINSIFTKKQLETRRIR